MKEFEEDAVDEQTQLALRLGKLSEFLRTDEFRALDWDEQLRMQMQEHAMFLYLNFLAERINNFGKDEQ